ncbi:Embryonic polyadenylate-binding protein 2 [Vulpes lagopus]
MQASPCLCWRGRTWLSNRCLSRELEAIRLKMWAMEQAHRGSPCPGTPTGKVESDHRSIYMGNVDYGSTAEELEAYFNPCGEVHWVTILCDKFPRHPQGLCLHRVCGQELSPGCSGAGPEHLPRLGHQGCCPKGPTCQGSAPPTVEACEASPMPEDNHCPSAASRAAASNDRGGAGGRGLGGRGREGAPWGRSRHQTQVGALLGSLRVIRRIEGRMRSPELGRVGATRPARSGAPWGQGWG